MTEYWLISAPGDKTCLETWETLNNLTSKQNSFSTNYKFHIPDLKVGTLDQLVGLSDDLGKLDAFVEQVTRKVAAYMGEVLEDQRDKWHENLLANSSQSSLDGENSSPEGGPDTPPNTPVTPSSHKMNKDHHKPWKDMDQEPTLSLGQHHQRHHHHHHQNHHHHSHHSHDKKSSGSQGGCDVRSANESSIYSCYQVHWCATSASSSPSASPSPISPCPSYSSDCSSDGQTRRQRINPNSRPYKTNKKSKTLIFGAEDHIYNPSNPRGDFYNHYDNNDDDIVVDVDDDDDDDDDDNDDDNDDGDVVDDDDNNHDDDDNDSSNIGKTDLLEYKQDQDDDNCGNLPNPGELPAYITRFQWDMAKYPIKQSLRNIADIISKQVGQIDADLKTKSTTYNNLKGSLQNLEKKQTGSLLTRNLADLVKKEHFILDSEYLSTLLVIVPKSSFQEWHAIYEKLTDMIVPRSTQLITQDADYGLYTVTLFKKVVEEFKLHAREKKFIVRDFTYNEEELAAGKNEITKLVTDKKKQFGPLVRWLKVNFSECFCAWIHVKALRVFVESVLRYGLPVNFQAILLHPHKKCAKRLRDVLNQLYAHLDSSATSGGHGSGNQDSVDIPGLGFGQNDYYPYVYYKINVDMVDNKG